MKSSWSLHVSNHLCSLASPDLLYFSPLERVRIVNAARMVAVSICHLFPNCSLAPEQRHRLPIRFQKFHPLHSHSLNDLVPSRTPDLKHLCKVCHIECMAVRATALHLRWRRHVENHQDPNLLKQIMDKAKTETRAWLNVRIRVGNSLLDMQLIMINIDCSIIM